MPRTTYYVVPAGAFFDSNWPDFPRRDLAEREIAERAEGGDHHDYGIFEVRLVSGSAKMTHGRTMHVVGERRVITAKHYIGGYAAHDDGMGEDCSPYGYGETPEAAIADLLETLNEQNLAA